MKPKIVMNNSFKRKIVFAFLMGIVTTGIVSFTVILINLGFTERFWKIWLKSWTLAFVIVVPVILIVSPVIGRFVEFLFAESGERRKDEN